MNSLHRRRLLAVLSSLAIAPVLHATAHAQTATNGYPNRPVKVVVAWSPGGATDLLARTVSIELSKQLGQQVVVDNRPGANGTIGHAQVAHAAADGYTLVLATNSTYAIAQHLYKSLPYQQERDLAPIALLAASPLILAVRPGLEARSVQDLLAQARKTPGKLNIASGGNGSTSHLAAELFMSLTGTTFTHVPYKGGGPATQAVAAGEVDAAFLDLGVAAPFANTGRLRAIGVTGNTRSTQLPDVPTVSQSGVPAFESTTTFALFAPAATPKAVVQQLATATRASLANPELRDKLQRQGVEIVNAGPEELARSVTTESTKWGAIIRDRHISLD
ncbi:ABC transporter substrate-binding protein [Pigmentiphaga litoralis]|uniref:Bug family tripartite tricarboxylate transporter substrate binding protein n=1 Tax=Pigmentiphaga litoralis TaxID=516702 RepID=UPI00167213A8|nr:tripartite tricarboxylate transporter substrate binding protein [Pigmentiphaga litoralis]GGX14878.1 ABC transporter substrate-binding protein [Pigmentiphaga litoralis]